MSLLRAVFLCPSLQRCVSRRRSRVSAGLTYSSVALHRFTLTLSLQAQTQTTFGSTNPRLILRHHLKTSDQTDRFRVENTTLLRDLLFEVSCRMGFLHPSLKYCVVEACLYQFHWIYTAPVLKTKTESLHISSDSRTQLVSSFALYMEDSSFVQSGLNRCR